VSGGQTNNTQVLRADPEPPRAPTRPGNHRGLDPSALGRDRDRPAAQQRTLNFVTLDPTAVTTPLSSWPGTMGYATAPPTAAIAPCAMCTSLWQTPQYFMSIWMSSGPGARRFNRSGLKLQVQSAAAMQSASTEEGAAMAASCCMDSAKEDEFRQIPILCQLE